MRKIERIEPQIPQIKRKKRVAAYARVSMESDRLNHSLSAQISYYSELIQKNPEWEYAGVYADSFISGTSIDKRAEFQRMISDCENGKIDILLTKSISRFARNTVDLLSTVRKLKALGIEVRFEKEHINSLSSSGEVMLSVLASFAQEESVNISNNVKWGVRKRFEKGIPNGKFRIYGYRWEGDKLVVVPEEAAVVKRIFQNFLDGKSRLETERELNSEGITTRAGCKWEDSNIRNILTNIHYTGNMLFQKEYIESPLTQKKKKNRGELPQYWVENTHEAIVDKETFDYVQKEMSRRRELGFLANKSLNLTCFSGKIKCGICGHSFVRNTRTNRAIMSLQGDKLFGWTCSSTKKKGRHCKANEIPEHILYRECAKALNLEEFDETVFLERVKQIVIPEHRVMEFHFKDGSTLTQKWVSTSKKDCWTDEYRAKASEYRRNHPINRPDISCLTSKIKCVHCDCNFRRGTQPSNTSITGKHHYWRCSKRDGCDTVGLREDFLKPLLADVLGIAEFDDNVFKEQIDHIDVLSATDLMIYFKDGRKISRIWESKTKRGEKSAENSNDNTRHDK